MAVLSLSPLDRVDLTDAGQVQGALLTGSDSRGLTDTLTAQVLLGRNVLDSTGLADGATVGQSASGSANLPESLTLTDAGQTEQEGLTGSDGLGLTDALTVQSAVVSGLSRDLQDTFGLTEPTTSMGVTEDLLDGAGLSDASASASGPAVSESLTFSDSWTTTLTYARNLADALGSTDSTAVTSVEPGDQRALTDGSGWTDFPQVTRVIGVIVVPPPTPPAPLPPTPAEPSLVFIPPTAPLRPMTGSRHVNHPAHSLFRHYRPNSAGINVWLIDGQLTTVDPGDPAARVFLGGHHNVVTEAEALLLVAAGYTVLEV